MRQCLLPQLFRRILWVAYGEEEEEEENLLRQTAEGRSFGCLERRRGRRFSTINHRSGLKQTYMK